MKYGPLAGLLIAAPALAAGKPPPLPPLPPLVLAATAPIITVTIAGQPLRLRVDGNTTRHVVLNATAAKRLDLADRSRLVAGKPVERGSVVTQVGKVSVKESTSEEIVEYQGRALPLTVASSDRDVVADADGLIGPILLPHDVIRFVRRAPTGADRTTRLRLRWNDGRGLLGEFKVGREDIDIVITPMAAESIATAAAASILAAQFGGKLTGPARDALISLGVIRPVRDVIFAGPVDVSGFRFDRIAARVFDWSGKTNIPDADISDGEAVVAGRAGAQREWAKLAIGNDHLAACAEIIWTRVPLVVDLICPATP